ncbi:MAG: ribonuclease H-like YkuK family protein [Bacteroidia bacterium]
MWRYLNGVPLNRTLDEVLEEIILRDRQAGFRVRVCIGTDSQYKGGTTEYATVVVILREGQGGKMLVKKERDKIRLGVKERMLKEVSMSIETAYALLDTLNKLNVPLEVHADINSDPQYKSQASYAEAKGYILGMGFEFRAKPFAFASSSCANKVVN